jgi:predicted mannosyl-3-phosphoglycerate phosphatase (HAD superfamily)
MLWAYLFYVWGCIPEITKNCQDMTNASSTYLGIAGGAIIGAIVSWWIYNRQKKTADMQDSALNSIKELDESHDRILKKLEDFDIRHETTLDTITELSKKIDALTEKQEKSENSIKSDSSKIINDSK